VGDHPETGGGSRWGMGPAETQDAVKETPRPPTEHRQEAALTSLVRAAPKSNPQRVGKAEEGKKDRPGDEPQRDQEAKLAGSLP
jgi:hypothetical protein